jgi:excisionase family DNA binding protein
VLSQIKESRKEVKPIKSKAPREDKRLTGNKRLYTLKEAGEYLGRSLWSMRELIWAGHLPVVRVEGSRKIYLDIVDLDAFIERNKSKYL